MALKRIKINLATFSYRNRGLEWSILGLLIICVIAVSAYLIHLAAAYQGEIIEYSNKIAKLERTLRHKGTGGKNVSTQLSKEDLKRLNSNLRFVQDLITKDIFPWDMVLSVLERNIPKGIFLDRMETESSPPGIKLSGRARSMGQISAFLKNLDLNEIFRTNRLVKFSVERDQGADPTKRDLVRFDIQCELDWNKMIKNLASWTKAPSGSDTKQSEKE